MDGHKFKGSLNQSQASLGYSERLSRRIKLKTNVNDRDKRERKKRAEFSQHVSELGLSPAHQAWNKETTTSRVLGV